MWSQDPRVNSSSWKLVPTPFSTSEETGWLPFPNGARIHMFIFQFSSVQFSRSVVSNSLLPHGLQHTSLPCPSPSPGACSNSCPSSRWCHPNHLILCHPLLHLPSIFPNVKVFFNESALHIRWPKYWSFSISPSNEHSALISYRIDCFNILASILRHSAFFMVQLSHPCMTTGKTIVLTRWTFVGKVMSLLFHMLSRLVIAFLSRSKHLLISWLQSPSAVILEPKK